MKKLLTYKDRDVTEKFVLLSVYFALLLDNLLLTAVGWFSFVFYIQ